MKRIGIRAGVFAVGALAGALVMGAGGLGGRAARAQNSWTPAGWGGGGLYWSAAFHPTKPDTIYMGGDVAGIYKTEDAGKHWHLINAGLSHYAVYALAIAAKDPETIYAGTTGGLCKSVDGGKTWLPLPETDRKHLDITAERDKNIRSIAIDPSDSNIVYAGTPRGKVFKSSDGGMTWKPAYECRQPKAVVAAVSISPLHPASIFAATSTGGVVISMDSGATWKSAETPVDATGIVASPVDSNLVYASFGKEGLYRSADAGVTWQPCGPGIDPKSRIVEVVTDPKDRHSVYCIATAGWSGKFYASHDDGKTWSETRRLHRDLAADPTLPDEGQASADIDLSKPTNLAISPSDPSRLFIAANWRPCISRDGGKSWEESDRGADISVVYDIRFSGPRTYASAMDEGVLASSDAGESWRQLWPRAYTSAVSGHNWRLAVSTAGGVDRVLSTCSPWERSADLVIISTDGGKTFTPAGAGLPVKRPSVNTQWGQGYLRALAPDPKNPDVIYAGVDGDPNADGSGGGGVFKSKDGGRTWTALPNQPASRRMFFALAVDPTDSNRLYWGACGKDGGLYRSDDGGEHWSRIFERESWIFNKVLAK